MTEDTTPKMPPELRRLMDELPFPFLLVGAFPSHGVVLSNVSLEDQWYLASVLEEHFTSEAYPPHTLN